MKGVKKREFAFFGACLLTLFTLSLSDVPSWAAPTKPKVNLNFSIVHAVGPQSHRHLGALTVVEELKKLIDGTVEVRVHHSGSLGSEAQMLESIQLGTIEMGVLSTPILVSVLPKMGVLDLPYLWRDMDHFLKVVDGPVGASLAKGAESHGFIVLEYWMGGIRNIYGNVKITNVDDVKGVKIRILQSPVYMETFKAFGAIPTPVSWVETYQALQTGVVNAAETALPSMIDAKQYEVSKYVILTRHAMNPVAVVVSAKWWNGLSKDIREVILQAVETGKMLDRQKYLVGDNDAIKFCESKGLQVIQPDLSGFRSKAQPVYLKFVDKFGQDTLDAIQSVR